MNREEIAKVDQEVRESGYSVLPSYLSEERTKVLKTLCEAELLFDTSAEYKFGTAKRFEPHKKKRRECPPELMEFFQDDLMNTLQVEWNTGINAYFITHDFIQVKEGEELSRNGYTHFDRFRCLKYFLYLTDVDINCGPLTVFPGSQILGEELRQKSWGETSEYGGVKNRIALDFPQLLDKYEEVPILAPAGTLVVFETSTWHKGGETKPGHERLIIRAHMPLQ